MSKFVRRLYLLLNQTPNIMKVSKNSVLGLMIVMVSIIAIGTSVKYHHETEEPNVIDKEILDRAYQDVIAEEESEWLIPIDHVIKVFDHNDELIDSRILSPEEFPDEEFSILLNQAAFLAEYNNNRIYRLNK